MKAKDGSRWASRMQTPSVGQRIVEGLEEAIAWSKDEDVPVELPGVKASEVRKGKGVIGEHPESVEDVLKDLR
jgi:hypothetical protein